MGTINLDRSVGPYTGISYDKTVEFVNEGRKMRIVLYGAYNAMGLIGSECNGIAVLDEDNRAVVTDEIAKESTGYYGPSRKQLELFQKLVKLPWNEFREIINNSPRLREEL